ncbi:hypothetical protein [Nocardia tengchongensis]|uniref:hypothetical protein n=1 Tax=Nocardia tengchongensis TaxID=2055889 RepID=UPI0036AFD6DD
MATDFTSPAVAVDEAPLDESEDLLQAVIPSAATDTIPAINTADSRDTLPALMC